MGALVMPYEYDELAAWNQRVGAHPLGYSTMGLLDFHRLQIERWLWDARGHMTKPIVEIGAEFRHEYMSNPYYTLGNKSYRLAIWNQEVKPDILGDIMRLPLASESIGTLVCTEVFEHVPYIFHAAKEVHRVLKPGGTAYLSSPFIWPTHETESYNDYWRITEQGWRFMFGGFDALIVTPTQMRSPSRSLWGQVAAWESMGTGWESAAPTGYLIEARR
jgi:SAM-dependent methyltransferase